MTSRPAVLRSVGREFQTRDPAALKAQSPEGLPAPDLWHEPLVENSWNARPHCEIQDVCTITIPFSVNAGVCASPIVSGRSSELFRLATDTAACVGDDIL